MGDRKTVDREDPEVLGQGTLEPRASVWGGMQFPPPLPLSVSARCNAAGPTKGPRESHYRPDHPTQRPSPHQRGVRLLPSSSYPALVDVDGLSRSSGPPGPSSVPGSSVRLLGNSPMMLIVLSRRSH